MTVDSSRSPFERLKQYYDHEEFVCLECGFEDEEGAWTAGTDGATVVYNHTCPRCGARREHRLEVSGHEAAREHAETH